MKILFCTSMRAAVMLGFLLSFSTSQAQDLLPVKGKWNIADNKEYVGVWKKSHRRGYLDGKGDGTVSGVTTILGNTGDVPVNLNFTGDKREEFALYRPTTRELIFYSDYTQSNSISLTRVVGNTGDKIMTGDWNGDGIDGFALYRPSTREIIYYQNYNSSSSFLTMSTGNPGDVPIVGNWDGVNGDSYALYRPSTREIWFFQNYNDTQPNNRIEIGNPGDTVLPGDWDGNGTDGVGVFRQPGAGSSTYQFWLYNTIGGSPTQSIFWTDVASYVKDVSAGRKFFYAQKVPHVDKDGNYRTTYDAGLSFVPKGLYNVPPSQFSSVYAAGYNLAFVWPNYYPLSQTDKNVLDATGNNLKTIPYLTTPGGIPFVGKFTGGRDLPGIASNDGSRLIYIDSNGDDMPDRQFTTGDPEDVPSVGDWNGDGTDEFALYKPSYRQIVYFNSVTSPAAIQTIETGNPGDQPVFGNWDGIGGDGYALYRPSTRQIWYFQNSGDTQPINMITVGNTGDKIIVGDWDGDGKDGFATYRPSTREFIFYQQYNSTTPFLTQAMGNPGDIPVSADWDGDGKDGYGVYQTDALQKQHQFWYYNNVTSNANPDLRSITFGNPLFESSTKKYFFGVYAADEPAGRNTEWQQNYDYLTAVYAAYSGVNSQVVFHVDIPYVSLQSNADYNYWWKRFAKLGEATAHDDYPIDSLASLNKTISSIALTIENARLETSENKPNWFVPQAFEDITGTDFKFYKPTADQYKAMVYTALVHGATGVLTFAYDDPIFAPLKGISPSSYPDLWNKAKDVNLELDALKPHLLSVTHPSPYNIYTNLMPAYEQAPIRSVLKLMNGYYILMTVNVTKENLNAIIQLPASIAPLNGNVERLFENTTTKIVAGAINDTYTGFGVHIYRFALPGTGGGGQPAVAEVSENSITSESEVLGVYPVPSKGSINFKLGNIPDKSIRLSVYDGRGNVVKIFNEQNPANKTISWDGVGDNSDRIKPGFYLYKLAGDAKTGKMGKFIVIE